MLERPYHLSYPLVFNDGGDWYMIPETARAGTVELYRAAAFPDEWEFVTELVTASVPWTPRCTWTTTVAYWLFTSLERPGRNRNDELHLFSSDALTGPWTPHPENPVVADARFARSAGRVFGRTTASSVRRRTARVGTAPRSRSRRITRLDAQHYEEEMVATLGADWHPGLVGTHTYNVDCGIEVVEAGARSPGTAPYRSSLNRRLGARPRPDAARARKPASWRPP